MHINGIADLKQLATGANSGLEHLVLRRTIERALLYVSYNLPLQVFAIGVPPIVRAPMSNAHDLLGQIRKTLAANGHTEALAEFDSLLGVASDVARRRLMDLERKR